MSSITYLLISLWLTSTGAEADAGTTNQDLHQKCLIIAGGCNYDKTHRSCEFLNNVEIIGKKCGDVPTLPVGNWYGNMIVTSGDQHVLHCGGQVSYDNYTPFCYVLDISSGVWKNHSRLVRHRIHSSSITMPGGVYILGGIRNGNTSDFLPKFTSSWERGPDVPYDFVGGCGARLSDEEFVLIGGFKSKKRVMTFNVVTGTWTRRPDLIQDRQDHACAFHQPSNSLIIAGGRADAFSTTEIIPIDTWIPREAGIFNPGRYAHAMVTFGGKNQTVYAIGGQDGLSSLSSILLWDECNLEWKMTPFTLNVGRKDPRALQVPASKIC